MKCSKCEAEKPRSDFYKNKNTKSGLQSYCKSCAVETAMDWNRAHRETAKATQAAYYHRQRVENTPQYIITLKKNRMRGTAWKRIRRDLVAAYSAARKAIKLKATPKWANKEEIKKFYELAMIKKKETGESWVVDHIVPLQSPLVCGLHVEHNLRVISGLENGRKWNKFWPDMP
jgi:hypothetical protein